MLGWVCERAAGLPMAELISELIWAPMGAEHDAILLHDGLGAAVHDGGLCATARDVARFGQMLLDGGLRSRTGAGRHPPGGPAAVAAPGLGVDADARGVFAASPAEWAFPGGWYRHQFWFRPGDHGDVLLCLGIHGQMLHVSRRTSTVCVKFSTWPDAQNPAYLEDTLRAFNAVGGFLAGRAPAGPGGRAGRGGLRPEPQRRHHAAAASAHRGLSQLFKIASRRRTDPGLTWRYLLPTGGFLITPRPDERAFLPSRAGVPVSAPTAPGRPSV